MLAIGSLLLSLSLIWAAAAAAVAIEKFHFKIFTVELLEFFFHLHLFCASSSSHTRSDKFGTKRNEMEFINLIWFVVVVVAVKRHLCLPGCYSRVRLWNVVNGNCNLADQWNRYHCHLSTFVRCVVCSCTSVCDSIVKLSLHLIKGLCAFELLHGIINFILCGLWKQLNHTHTLQSAYHQSDDLLFIF